MSDTPFWLQNEGKFDRPSSSVPTRAVRSISAFADGRDPFDTRPTRQRASFVTQRMADAERDGVVAVGVASICERIDAAIAKLSADGHGNASSIYLIECDLLALREAQGSVEEFAGVPVRPASGSTGSKVFSKRGVGRAVRRPKKGEA